MITEVDLKQSFAKKVKCQVAAIDTSVIWQAIRGIRMQIETERFPDRKKRLKAIIKELKIIIGV
jgi:hypothetical protein